MSIQSHNSNAHPNTQDAGIALLRISLGVIFIAHSLYLKLFVFTLPGTVGFFQSLGLPGFSAYLVFLAEAVGGVMLLVGFKQRLAALALVPISLGATWAHLGAGWLFTNQGGGWEYPLFLAVTTAVVALLPEDRFGLAVRSGAQTVRGAA